MFCAIEDGGQPADTGDGSIHNLGLVGHIEDIAVAKDQQGKKLGLRIIQALDSMAQKVGCYKVSSLRLHCVSATADKSFEDDSRLLRNQRRILRQMRIQKNRSRNGTLLRQEVRLSEERTGTQKLDPTFGCKRGTPASRKPEMPWPLSSEALGATSRRARSV